MKDAITLAILLAPIVGWIILRRGTELADKHDALDRLERGRRYLGKK